MSALLLRTMTMKSRWGGGTFMGQTVANTIDQSPNYAIKAYFEMSMISFTPDVLDILGITEEYRIPKPGNDLVMRHKFFSDKMQGRIANLSGLDRAKDYSHWKKVCRNYKSRIAGSNARLYSPLQSKGRLAAKNKGEFRK